MVAVTSDQRRTLDAETVLLRLLLPGQCADASPAAVASLRHARALVIVRSTCGASIVADVRALTHNRSTGSPARVPHVLAVLWLGPYTAPNKRTPDVQVRRTRCRRARD
jgi:hypothetical protein